MLTKEEELPKVLIVDDDAEMLYLAQYLLEQCGCHSDTAMTLDSFNKAYSQAPDIVMLDLTMPQGASEAITEIMIQHQARHPIIYMTGMSVEEIERRRQHAQAQGLKIAGVLHKPFWIEDVAKVLATALAMSK